MTKTETITKILSLNISDEDKAILIQNMCSSEESAPSKSEEPIIEESATEDPFVVVKWDVFNEHWCIYKRDVNPHKNHDAKYVYFISIKRKGSMGKALFFDETDQYGKKGWLYFDPETNPRKEGSEWAKYYGRVTDCCRYSLFPHNNVYSFQDVIDGKASSKDFGKVAKSVNSRPTRPTIDPRLAAVEAFDNALPFT